MKKSMAFGAIAILALGIAAAHSVGFGSSQPVTAYVAPAATKPMSPLQMMRRDRDTIVRGDAEAAF